MTYATEFPDFPAADMPALPAGFADVSWHNDACPSFLLITEQTGPHPDSGKGVVLFVDYADAANREWPEMKRFTLQTWDDGATGEVAAESDDFADILAFLAFLAAR